MFLCSISADFPYIGHMGAPNDFGSNFGRKSDQNLPNFFFQKKQPQSSPETHFHQKRSNRTNFHSYLRHGAGPLHQGVDSTVVKVLSKSSPSITVTTILYFWRLAIVPRPAPRQNVIL